MDLFGNLIYLVLVLAALPISCRSKGKSITTNNTNENIVRGSCLLIYMELLDWSWQLNRKLLITNWRDVINGPLTQITSSL